MGDGNIGQIRQPLVGGALVEERTQEYFGLLTLGSASGTCSASLLRNDWAITAAHCVEATNPMTGTPTPDPARPGQFLLDPPAAVRLSAAWDGGQTRQAVRIETFRPLDIAIVQLDRPFTVFGATTGYTRRLFRDGQFPYWGEEVPVVTLMFGRGIDKFAHVADAGPVKANFGGPYRMGWAKTTRTSPNLYWYPSEGGQMIAGGDSGGPSYAWVLGGYVLMGVHALCALDCLPGLTCGPWPGPGLPPPTYSPWDWVAATPESADAPVEPVADRIDAILGPPPPAAPALEPPPPGFIGTFGTTPPDTAPFWVYSIQEDGVLLWYRKDNGQAPWQGPKQVGNGWAGFADVIPAGGNSFYALTRDGLLKWYRHDGFSTGEVDWRGPVDVGRGWTFRKIFSGGDGVVYAIQDDGTLLWYRHAGYADSLDGTRAGTWAAPRVIGSGWAGFRDVFSTGQGTIYAVRPDGDLLQYRHGGHATGESTWLTTAGRAGGGRVVGTGWQAFRQIVPAGDGALLAIRDDGTLLYYKHLGFETVPGPRPWDVARVVEQWEGPLTIGSGWQSFKKALALLPATPPVVR